MQYGSEVYDREHDNSLFARGKASRAVRGRPRRDRRLANSAGCILPALDSLVLCYVLVLDERPPPSWRMSMSREMGRMTVAAIDSKAALARESGGIWPGAPILRS